LKDIFMKFHQNIKYGGILCNIANKFIACAGILCAETLDDLALI